MSYEPKPIDISTIVLSNDILELTEKLAENVHDIWAKQRLAEFWTYGSTKDAAKMETPLLVPYDQLSEAEKELDRKNVLGTLKAIIALGYHIEKAT